MDGVVARRADDEGLTSHLCHELRPCGLWSPRLAEVGELADLEDYAKPPEWATGTRALKY
jgi:hypothetical protein